MDQTIDDVARIGLSMGYTIAPRTVIVEGTSDMALFRLASRLENKQFGRPLLDDRFAVVASGEGERGGTSGVVRELVTLRGVGRICLRPDGRPKYRFVGLFDNDAAGASAVRLARSLDSSILEYTDVFRLWPVMPMPGCMDPTAAKKIFERENSLYTGLDWEIEDLLSADLISAFLAENPGGLRRSVEKSGSVHYEYTTDGKARLHRFVKDYAVHQDLVGICALVRSLRYYMGLAPAEPTMHPQSLQ
jgi:hypothetical protein